MRIVIKDAFDIDIKLDYSFLANFVLRVGNNFNEIPLDPRDAKPILEKFEKLDDQGDGIKSFVATALTMISIERPIIMIDEPEAFLHPPQAMKLGEFIAENSNNDRQIIIVTHSSDLLRGIINKRQDINIIRVDRNKNDNKIYPLDADDLVRISNNPLLSSSRILEGLFYKGAVIVEADGDSAFYQRASRRLEGPEDIHYTYAHGKQAIPKIIEDSYLLVLQI
ncbi:AAA domain, putative AbiEii toxin, Type IV TA system [uncultured archaeon]|nr:AAA domain, putative AbiEii toxin, Type IV TA system [uncultured archaeon]